MMTLGITGVLFAGLLGEESSQDAVIHFQMILPYGLALGGFLCGIAVLMGFIVYPEPYEPSKRKWQLMLFIAAGIFFLLAFTQLELPVMFILSGTLAVLLILIYVITKVWIAVEMGN